MDKYNITKYFGWKGAKAIYVKCRFRMSIGVLELKLFVGVLLIR